MQFYIIFEAYVLRGGKMIILAQSEPIHASTPRTVKVLIRRRVREEAFRKSGVLCPIVRTRKEVAA